jgi:hypothetical protein
MIGIFYFFQVQAVSKSLIEFDILCFSISAHPSVCRNDILLENELGFPSTTTSSWDFCKPLTSLRSF